MKSLLSYHDSEPLRRIMDNTPQDLRLLPQWLVWKNEERNNPSKPEGKDRTKTPYNPLTRRRADTTDPATWTDFDTAVAVWQQGGFDGIGFVFVRNGGLAGVDFDKCRDPDTGEIAPEVAALVDTYGTYAEVSPSGTGLKIIGQGIKPGELCKAVCGWGKVEIYDHSRFFTVTGDIYGGYTTLADIQETLNQHYALLFPKLQSQPEPQESAPNPTGTRTAELSDAELLERMFASKNGAKIRDLWNGDTYGHNDDDSRRDLALLSHLAWWTNGKPAWMERLFGQSECGKREKWTERADYRERTIKKALQGMVGGYNPQAHRTTPRVPESAADTPSATTPGLKLLQVGAFLQTVGDPPPMLVEGILPYGSLVLLSSKPKYGKSLLALDLAESIVIGRDVWETRSVNQPGPVVYLGMEDGDNEIARRLLTRGLTGQSELPLYIYAERFPLGTQEGVKVLTEAVAPLNPVLVIVDTARESLDIKDHRDPSEAVEKLRPLRQFARSVCTVLLVSHNRKSEANDAVDEITGSNGFTSAVDGWISARAKQDQQRNGILFRRLSLNIDGRGGMRGFLNVEMDPDTLRFREVSHGEQNQEQQDGQAQVDSQQFSPIRRFLEANGPSTVAEIEQGTSIHERKVRRLLDAMFKAHVLRKTDRYNPNGRPSQVYDLLTHEGDSKGNVTKSESQEPDTWDDSLFPEED